MSDDVRRYSITEAQIDEAWGDVWHDGRPCLMALGVFACSECCGRGDVTWQYWDTEDPVVYTPCPRCGGHGWVLREVVDG